jgi:hypothetical protein
MTPERSGRARPWPIRPTGTGAAVRAARPTPASDEDDSGSGPPAGSSADAGEPGRLTAPVRAGQDRMDRTTGELAPSAAGRAGSVRKEERRSAATPPNPAKAAAKPWSRPSTGPQRPLATGSRS